MSPSYESGVPSFVAPSYPLGQPPGTYGEAVAYAPLDGQAQAYSQIQPAPWPLPPQRNTVLFVASICLIFAGSMQLLSSLLVFIALSQWDWYLGPRMMAVPLVAALNLACGILGVVHSANQAKAKLLIGFGVVQLLVSLLAMTAYLMGGTTIIWTLLSLAAPIAYLVGAYCLLTRVVPTPRRLYPPTLR